MKNTRKSLNKEGTAIILRDYWNNKSGHIPLADLSREVTGLF